MSECPHKNLCSGPTCGACQTAGVLYAQNEWFAAYYGKKLMRDCNLPVRLEDDLLQAARLGMYKAALSFDTNYGVKFTTYAARAIKYEVLRSAAEEAVLGKKSVDAKREGRAVPDREGFFANTPVRPKDVVALRDEVACLLALLPTDEHREVVRDYYLNAMTINEIARTRRSCSTHVGELLIESARIIVVKTGRGSVPVLAYRKQGAADSRYVSVDATLFTALWNSNARVHEIARLLGVSLAKVNRRRKELKLSPRGLGQPKSGGTNGTGESTGPLRDVDAEGENRGTARLPEL